MKKALLFALLICTILSIGCKKNQSKDDLAQSLINKITGGDIKAWACIDYKPEAAFPTRPKFGYVFDKENAIVSRYTDDYHVVTFVKYKMFDKDGKYTYATQSQTAIQFTVTLKDKSVKNGYDNPNNILELNDNNLKAEYDPTVSGGTRGTYNWTASPIPVENTGGGGSGGTTAEVIFWRSTQANQQQPTYITLNGSIIYYSPNNMKLIQTSYSTAPTCSTAESCTTSGLCNFIKVAVTQTSNTWVAKETNSNKTWSGTFTKQPGCTTIEIK